MEKSIITQAVKKENKMKIEIAIGPKNTHIFYGIQK